MIVRSSIVLLLLVLLLTVLAAGVLISPAGSRLMTGWAEDLLAPALSVDGVEGSVLGELCAARLSYRHERVTLAGENVCVQANLWRSFDFLQVSLKSLTASSLKIQTLPGSEAEAGSGGLALPLAIEVERARIELLQINELQLAQLATRLQLSNRDLESSSNFLFDARRITLDTSGPWNALLAEVETFDLNAEITLDLTQDSLPYRIRASSTRFDLTPYAGRALVLDNAELTVAGDLEGYRVDGRALITDPLAVGRAQVSGRGTWQGLELSRLEIRNARLTDLPVEISTLDAAADIEWREPWRFSLSNARVEGVFYNQALAVSVAGVTVDESGVAVIGGSLRPVSTGSEAPADQRVQVTGRIGFDRQLALTVQGRDIDLAQFDPRLGGSLAVDLELGGIADDPDLRGDYQWDNPGFGEYAATSVAGRIEGHYRDAELTLALDSDQANLTGELQFLLSDTGMSLNIRTLILDLNESPVGALKARLNEEMTVLIGAGTVSFAETCFELSAASDALASALICGSIDYPSGPAAISLASWPLPRMDVSGDRVSVTGVASAELQLETLQPLTGKGAINLSELVAHHEDTAPLDLGAVDVLITLQDGIATAEAASHADQGLLINGRLSSELKLPLETAAVNGNLYLELDGIWAAESLLPMDLAYELAAMRGVMALQATADGSVADLLISGKLTLKDVGWDVLALNARFNDFDLEAVLADSEQLTFSSEGELGKGRLGFSGTLSNLSVEPKLTSQFVFNKARVIDLPDYSAVVNGTLALEMNQQELRLDGDLGISRADIRVAELPETALSVSDDEVLIGTDEVRPVQQIRTTDLRIELGDAVLLEAFGLEARLVGNLRLREAPGKLQELTGIITLREGVFEAYGQALKVERGQLTFTGPIDDPTVDVVATRVVNYQDRDYRISLVITGTAQRLSTTVRSSPTLPEDDALALLITGQTFSQMSSSEQTNVYGAAISLGLFGASNLTQGMASNLGLEEIILDQDAEGNVEVGAALRLNRDFYLRYTYGVFSRLGGVLLRYRLNNRFSVQAKTGDAHSIEIRYGVDD